MYDYNKCKNKLMTADEAVKLIHDGDRVFIGINANISYVLCDALWRRRNELHNVDLGLNNCLDEQQLLSGTDENPFKNIYSYFCGVGERAAEKAGRNLYYTSYHLSQVETWFRKTFKPTVAMFNVSEPDDDGRISFGPAGMSAYYYAKEMADRVIIQINKNVPYMNAGELCYMNIDEADAIVLADTPSPELPDVSVDETAIAISKHILAEIPDGSTIQVGIGGLSTAVAYGLKDKNDLGIHTELLTQPLAELMQRGNINNKYKGYMDGKSVFSFAMGTAELYKYLDHNPLCYGDVFANINDAYIVGKNKKMMSINAAMSMNLFGEVAADMVGYRQFSAVGGQLDFVRGAQLSEGGKSFLACTSSFVKNGVRKSRIVLNFEPGMPVTTPRSDVQYVATEYGCINLKELTMEERVRAMISLAHPDFRDQLMDEAKEKHLIW